MLLVNQFGYGKNNLYFPREKIQRSKNKDIFIDMNAADRKEFDLIHNKIDNITKSIEDLKEDMSMAHGKTDASLSFLKENLFNPHEGLWSETKQNTQFRENSQKWRGVIGIGFVGLLLEKVWSLFTS